MTCRGLENGWRMVDLKKIAPERIVILRALQLGDLLCAVPAWRALRRALPQAHITLVGLPWARGFVERFDSILDGMIEFPGVPAFPEQEPRLHLFPAFLAEVQSWEFDLALQMQGSGTVSNTLVSLFGARELAGFTPAGWVPPEAGRFLEYPEGEHEIRRLLSLVEFLGFPSQGEELEFPLQAQDWASLRAVLREMGEPGLLQAGGYVCLHPGARSPERRWPVERFAALADALAGLGLKVVITGAATERELVSALLARMRDPSLVVDLSGRTDLGALAALISGARLLICNDTGVSHLAAALRTPSLVLFSASDPRRWAPLNGELHRAVLSAPEVSAGELFERAVAFLEQLPPAPKEVLTYAA